MARADASVEIKQIEYFPGETRYLVRVEPPKNDAVVVYLGRSTEGKLRLITEAKLPPVLVELAARAVREHVRQVNVD